ncbi:class I SAM-dependent methyltransferase [Nocardia alni]|uniref:class I SAM-dependent methyltransferase n=1 Tax=Nocardia alni TaxID=2815723 RepID=UPI001C244490|nr:class I SAM-dependent methyltransferase [Nocardia alni]
MPATPFTDPHLIANLYNSPARLVRRTRSLHAAKTRGADAAATITELAAQHTSHLQTVCDIGCGRGSTTLRLATGLRPTKLLALDQSPALLDVAVERCRAAGHAVTPICADFHTLPMPSGSIDLAVAAFCLYHSTRPEAAVAEIARCLAPAGRAVLVTKSADSYAELDELVAAADLDPDATTRPSLYQTFHAANAPTIVATSMTVIEVVEQRHEFRFDDLEAVSTYLATSPKYSVAEHLRSYNRITDELRRRLPNTPVLTTSTVSYIVAEAN